MDLLPSGSGGATDTDIVQVDCGRDNFSAIEVGVVLTEGFCSAAVVSCRLARAPHHLRIKRVYTKFHSSLSIHALTAIVRAWSMLGSISLSADKIS